MSSRLAELARGLSRSADRPIRRPMGIVYWLDTPAPVGSSVMLALQHIAVQSVYFVLASATATAISSDPAAGTRFLCLSILAVALWQGLQLLTWGPLGSGYPVPGTHAPAMLGPYATAGLAGVSFGAAGAMVIIAGAVAVVLSFAIRRLRLLIPNEVAGVVVMLIGVSLILLGSKLFGLQPDSAAPDPMEVVVFLFAIATMVVTSLSRTRAARLSVLVGTAAGAVLAVALGCVSPDAGEVVSQAPWFALPEPWAPDFSDLQAEPLAAFLLALVAAKVSAAGGFLMIQRAADADWTRPDSPPVQRGLLANGVSIALAGLVGAAAPGPATAAAGLSVATGTLARRIVWIGTGALVLLSLCPKVVALGLGSGALVAVSPLAFSQYVPALASPLTLGALVAFFANLATMPMVTQSAETVLALDTYDSDAATEWTTATGGSWGLKPQTARLMERAIVELSEVLALRGVQQVRLVARREEDRVVLRLRWNGAALPTPHAAAPSADDLLQEGGKAQEALAVWLATRDTRFSQRTVGSEQEFQLIFED